ncbi:hypothetical protein [Asaia sp. As-1742]|uniref:hypothetical protein n=1 Tax=Asaia sp. As-1742 TaxID=2608325 RepID=UPI00141E24BD|nr:hypothetical protein [Asaia sp. As-1742]NIE81556.1 hypothetical protein [Asaia sp. As-1742]
MHEYEDIEDPDMVSQGDVIEWVGDCRKSPWSTYGIVVTADCDLFRDKHNGYISYVPAWLTEDFLWFRWRIEMLEQPRRQAFQRVATRLTTWREKNGKGNGTLSLDAVYDWLRRVGPETMLLELGVQDKGQQNTLMDVIKPAMVLDAALEAPNLDLDLLINAYSTFKPGDDTSAFIKNLQRNWAALPGDIFHLPAMPDGTDGDLFLLLRHIRQIRADELTAKPDDIRSGVAKAKRIARITAPYRYAITQNLAKVFSDIGLPEEFEARRATTAQRFCSARIKQ